MTRPERGEASRFMLALPPHLFTEYLDKYLRPYLPPEHPMYGATDEEFRELMEFGIRNQTN